MVHKKIGIMPSIIFAFSTWVTLQSFHGFLGFSASSISADVCIAALSNHLQISKITKILYNRIMAPDFCRDKLEYQNLTRLY